MDTEKLLEISEQQKRKLKEQVVTLEKRITELQDEIKVLLSKESQCQKTTKPE